MLLNEYSLIVEIRSVSLDGLINDVGGQGFLSIGDSCSMRSEDGVSLCSSQGTLGEASLLLNHLSDGFRAEGSSEGDQGQKKYRNNKSSHKQ